MAAIPAVICLIAGYLIGSIMTAVKIAKSKRVDIRKCGSGNAGSTNVLRTFGWKWGLICLACDCAKGALSVAVGHFVGYVCVRFGLVISFEGLKNIFGCFALLGAIFGHLLPVFYNFRGGKCVAVALGGLLVLAPLELLAALVIGLILVLITRMVSVGSIVGTLFAAAFVIIRNWGDIPLIILAIIIAAVIVTAHLPNIQRIMEGRERRLDRIEWERDTTTDAVPSSDAAPLSEEKKAPLAAEGFVGTVTKEQNVGSGDADNGHNETADNMTQETKPVGEG